MNQNNKIALVTGAAKRIGRAVAMSLARRGCHIVLHYNISISGALATAEELRTYGVKVLPIQADLRRPDQIEAMIEQAVTHFGGLDILVNSAASFVRADLQSVTLDIWNEILAVNLTAPMLCIKHAAPILLRQESSVVINICDLYSELPTPTMLAHGVAKAGLLNLTRALALELAPRVRVNAVIPGIVLPPDDASADYLARTAEKNLIKQWGNPDQVAQAVLFLIENDFMVGEALHVDGGESLAWRLRHVIHDPA